MRAFIPALAAAAALGACTAGGDEAAEYNTEAAATNDFGLEANSMNVEFGNDLNAMDNATANLDNGMEMNAAGSDNAIE